MLGRWWSPSWLIDGENHYSGPFIFWSVDDPHQPANATTDTATDTATTTT